MLTMADLYAILGVEKDADAPAIKRAYRKLVKEHHPDKGGDAAIFQQVQGAWEVLSDPERKQRYDETGDAGDLTQRANQDRAAALSLVAQLVVQALDRYDAKVSDMRKHLCEAIERESQTTKWELERANAKHKSMLDKIEAAKAQRARWKKKSPEGEDFIGNALATHIAALTIEAEEWLAKEIAQREMAERARKIALDMLTGYEYTTDKPTAAEVFADKKLLAGLWAEAEPHATSSFIDAMRK